MNQLNQRTDNIKSITFFFPYKEVSGVPVLFVRMSRYIAENYGIETHVIDYPDGCMTNMLKDNTKVRLHPFRDGVPINIPPDTILIMQSILPYTMRPELKINSSTRIVFWTLYQFNLIPTIIPLQFFRHIQAKYKNYNKFIMNTLLIGLRNELKEFIETATEKKSIFYSDESIFRNTAERLSLNINYPIYMPIPCEVFQNQKINKISGKKDSVSFCWLGRIADFKIYMLIYTIQKLSEYAKNNRFPIEMYIIGEGPKMKMIDRLNLEHEFFHIVKAGMLTEDKLNHYLLEKIDVLTAMGTSALEGAKLGVPTIVVDISYSKISGEYKFKWIFEVKNYVLGDIVDKSSYEKNNKSLDNVIELIINNSSSISERTHEYCINNHSLPVVGEKFINAIKEASFKYNDFKSEILRKSMFRKLYEFLRDNYRSMNKKFIWT